MGGTGRIFPHEMQFKHDLPHDVGSISTDIWESHQKGDAIVINKSGFLRCVSAQASK